MKKYIGISGMLLVIVMLAACGPTRTVVTTRPATPVIVRPAAPAPGYVWVDGNWYRSGGHYIYRQGYWAQPRRKVYIQGQWAPRGNGWYWQRGRWTRPRH